METIATETLDPAAGWDAPRAEALAGKLAGYPGSAYRRAYLDGLFRSGKAFLEGGNGRTAAYCLDKVEAELELAAQAAAREEAAQAASPEEAAEGTEAGNSESDAALEDGQAVSSEPSVRRPRGPRKAKARPALERLRNTWREERLRKAEEVLARFGSRLTVLERKAYRESLSKWNQAVKDAADSPAASSAARRADHALLDLRRRLYGRILKSQKAVIVRRANRGTSLALVQVHEQFPGPIGPYNDRQNLEGVLTLLAQADPAWVEEFLELYKDLSGLQAIFPTQPR